MIVSNGVEVERLAPPACDCCSAERAVVVVRVTGSAVVRRVCESCLIEHDGRRGWPRYADLIGGFAGATRA
jgi:hypothetical protein